MAKVGRVEGGKRQGGLFLRTSPKRLAGSRSGIEKQIAIAAGDQSVGTAQDGADLVPQRVIAPVAGSDRRVSVQRFGDLPLCRAGASPVMGAQIEDMAHLRLPRQRSVGWGLTLAFQVAPKTARGVEAKFKRIIERKGNRIYAGFCGAAAYD